GARLEPGSSPGCASFKKAVFLSGATLAIEIEGPTACTEYDQIVFDEFLSVDGATLELSGQYLPIAGDTFIVGRANRQEPSSGPFSGLSNGATLEFNGALLEINYSDGFSQFDIYLATLQGPDQVTWTGAVDSDWYNGDNWSNGAVPTPTQDVLIEAGDNPAVLPSGEVSVARVLLLNNGDLTIAEGAILTLTGSTQGLVAKSGALTINGNLLVVGASVGGALLEVPVEIGVNGMLAFEEMNDDVVLKSSLNCAGQLLLSGGSGLYQQRTSALVIAETGTCQITQSVGTGLILDGNSASIAGQLIVTESGDAGVYVVSVPPQITTTGSLEVLNATGHGLLFDNNDDYSIRNNGLLSIIDAGLNAIESGIIVNNDGSTFRCDGNIDAG
ncbi:MAG: hypothetical protein AAGA62_17600, partial [Bacteroidota bacterium]